MKTRQTADESSCASSFPHSWTSDVCVPYLAGEPVSATNDPTLFLGKFWPLAGESVSRETTSQSPPVHAATFKWIDKLPMHI